MPTYDTDEYFFFRVYDCGMNFLGVVCAESVTDAKSEGSNRFNVPYSEIVVVEAK